MYETAVQLKLTKEYRRDMEPVLLNRLNDALAASADRDADCADADDALEGVDAGGIFIPYEGACDIVDPIIREQHTTAVAQATPPLRRDTLIHVRSRRALFKEGARKTEVWLTDTLQEEKLPQAYYLYLSNIFRDKAAVMAATWCEETSEERITLYTPVGESGEYLDTVADEDGEEQPFPYDPEDRVPGTKYAAIPHTREKRVQKADFRVVDLADFYLYPANAPSVKRATFVFERILLSQDDLLTGITTYGYDKEAVMELIKKGPTNDTAANGFRSRSAYGDNSGGDNKARQDEIEGVSGAVMQGEDGVYECFLGFGHLPKLWDAEGRADLPKKYWQQDACVMLCPGHGKVFKVDLSPYPRRPYFMGSLLPKNGRAYGSGMVEILEPVAREMTHWTRAVSNALDHQITPVVVADDESFERNKNRQLWPGKWIKEGSVPNAIRPLQKERTALDGMNMLGFLKARAGGIVSAEGWGQVNEKQPLVAEMQMTMSATDTKFDLFQWNAYSILPDIGAWRVEMELLFNPDFAGSIDGPEKEEEITANDLRGEYRYAVAPMNSDTSDQAKQSRNAAKLNVQMGYFGAAMQFPDRAEFLYNGARQALVDMEERTPEDLLGAKPEPFQAPVMPPGGMPPPLAAGGLPPGAMNGNGMPHMQPAAIGGFGA